MRSPYLQIKKLSYLCERIATCEMVRPKYPKGEQNIESIREAGKGYSDKTAIIYKLLEREKFVFLARPSLW